MAFLPTDATARRRFVFAVAAMAALVAASNILVQFQINDWLTWGALTYPVGSPERARLGQTGRQDASASFEDNPYLVRAAGGPKPGEAGFQDQVFGQDADGMADEKVVMFGLSKDNPFARGEWHDDRVPGKKQFPEHAMSSDRGVYSVASRNIIS